MADLSNGTKKPKIETKTKRQISDFDKQNGF
jgi:hypothetical protein